MDIVYSKQGVSVYIRGEAFYVEVAGSLKVESVSKQRVEEEM